MIKLEYQECGAIEQIFIDDKRRGIWCAMCGELDQIEFEDYDYVELEDER